MSVIFLNSNTSVEIVLMLLYSSFFSITRHAWFDKLANLVHGFEFGNRSWRGYFRVPSFLTVQFCFWAFLSKICHLFCFGIKIFRSLHFKLNFFWNTSLDSTTFRIFCYNEGAWNKEFGTNSSFYSSAVNDTVLFQLLYFFVFTSLLLSRGWLHFNNHPRFLWVLDQLSCFDHLRSALAQDLFCL